MAVISTDNAEHYTWGDRCDGWHLVRSEGLSVIQEAMPPATSEQPHYHTRSRQFFYVLSGILSILLDGVRHTLQSGQGLEVSPGARHRVFNDSANPVSFLVVSAPPAQADRVPASA